MPGRAKMNLTPEEEKLILTIRAEKPPFGEVYFVVYYRHGKVIRIAVERVIESKAIKEG